VTTPEGDDANAPGGFEAQLDGLFDGVLDGLLDFDDLGGHIVFARRLGDLVGGVDELLQQRELVGIDEPLKAGKIRDANSYSNAAQVRKYGGIPVPLGIARDREEEISERLRAGISQGVDLIIVSGGVSVGDFDMVKKVLAAEGRIEFWRVRMKPGKPLAFGYLEFEDRGVPVIGTPGNPVSTMISFLMFARPAILRLLGARNLEPMTVTATFADSIPEKDGRRHTSGSGWKGRMTS
jgi:molybdenum cofactor synthesis domain-containing protein